MSVCLLQVVDISVAPLAVSSLRESVMDFTFPFYLEYTAVLYGHGASKDTHKFSFFLLPFHWVVSIVSIPV